MQMYPRLLNILKTRERWFIAALILGLSVAGGIAVFYSTDLGTWVSSDTVGYFEAAENLASGQGLNLIKASGVVEPLQFHAPFFPIVLGAAKLFGFDLLTFTRWLNIFAFVFLIILLGAGSYRFSENLAFSIGLILFVLSNPVLLESFDGAMSEPIFYVVGLSSFTFLLLFFRSGKRRDLILSSILASLAFLSRYVGISILISGFFGILTLNAAKYKERIVNALLFLLLGSLPMAIWLISVMRTGYRAATFLFLENPLWIELIPIRKMLVNEWWKGLHLDVIIPSLEYRSKLIALIGFLVVFSFASIKAIKRANKLEKYPFRNYFFQSSLISLFFTVSYISFFSIVFLYFPGKRTILNDRVLLPINFSISIVFFAFLLYLLDIFQPRRSVSNFIVFLPICMVVTSGLPLTWQRMNMMHENGQGYTSRMWQESAVIEAVKTLDKDIPIITNDTMAVQFYTNRRSYEMHEIFADGSEDITYRYGENHQDDFQRFFREQDAALVLFDKLYWQLYPLYEKRTQEMINNLTNGLYCYFRGWDGGIYFYREVEAE